MYYNKRMRTIDFTNLIQETVGELTAAEKMQSNARLRMRAQFLRLLKSGQANQLKQAAKVVGITPKHASSLWKQYREVGLGSYLTLQYKARTARLSGEQQAQLLQKATTGFRSQAEAREYLREEFACHYTQQGVSVLFQRLKIKAKQPRPANVLADVEEQSRYKKTLSGG